MATRYCLGLALLLTACAGGSPAQDESETGTGTSELRTVDGVLLNPSKPGVVVKTPTTKPPLGGVLTTDFASVEDVPLWLIELEVTTADVSDAGTDDTVTLRMKTRDGGSVDLDVGGDDRERGDTQRYIVNPWSVRSIRDIEQLELYKNGDDGWAIASLALRVNGDATPIFSHTFASPQWLDNDSGHARNVVFASSQLRAHPNWSASGHPALLQPPADISGDLLQRMIEGAMGDALQETPRIAFGTKYGPSYVEAERASDTVTNVDLDLEDPNGIFSAIELDTDFSITWSCVAGNIDFELSKFRTPEVDASYMTFPQGRFYRSVEDMLLRLRALTKNRPYRCSTAPTVRADGGIQTHIEPRPTGNVWTVGQNVLGSQAGVLATDLESTIEDVPLWNVRVETETANVEDANTDDRVILSLTDNNDFYYLSRNADNRERGAVERFLVTIPNIHRVRDIKRLDLRLPPRDTDGWCVQRVALFVNDEPTPLFEQHFDQCRWVDSDEGDQTPLTIPSSELRADPRWSLAGRPNIWNPSPSQLIPSYLRSRLENPLLAMTGKSFDDCANLSCIQIERGSDRSVEVNFKYKTVLDFASDDHMEVNFDLEFRCLDGRLKVDARNVLGRGTDIQPLLAFGTFLNGFGDYFENMTLIRHCTADARVIDYGTTLLNLETL